MNNEVVLKYILDWLDF